jgi:hypothetical protein
MMMTMSAVSVEAIEHRTLNAAVKATGFEGLTDLHDSMTKNQSKYVLPAEQTYSLNEWLKSKGVTLSKENVHRFANLVAETYRTVSKKEPKKEYRITDNEKRSLCMVFTQLEFPIVQIAFNKLTNS